MLSNLDPNPALPAMLLIVVTFSKTGLYLQKTHFKLKLAGLGFPKATALSRPGPLLLGPQP